MVDSNGESVSLISMGTPVRNTERTFDPDMVWIPGGTFRMGAEDFYAEERPVHAINVSGFWMDQHLVTNKKFRQFVEETGYQDFGGAPTEARVFPWGAA